MRSRGGQWPQKFENLSLRNLFLRITHKLLQLFDFMNQYKNICLFVEIARNNSQIIIVLSLQRKSVLEKISSCYIIQNLMVFMAGRTPFRDLNN